MEEENLIKSANEGDIESIKELADYYFGDNKIVDAKKAAYWYYELAKQGNAYGEYSIGYCYRYGIGVEKSYDEAVYWFKKASEKNYSAACFELGFCYKNGLGIEKSYEFALECFMKAADENYIAAFEAAKILIENIKSRENAELAIELLIYCADNNYDEAIYYLSDLYFNGSTYIRIDTEKALMYKEILADRNHAESLYDLGYCYEHAYGVDFDFLKAIEYLEKSASLGFHAAYLELGDIYSNQYNVKNKNISIPVNMELAKEYYDKAFSCGNIVVCERLANIYYNQKDFDKFVFYLKKGIEAKSCFCQYRYGMLLLTGQLIKKNPEEGFQLIKKAADQLYLPALKTISKLYKKAIGIEKSTNEYKRYKELYKNEKRFQKDI